MPAINVSVKWLLVAVLSLPILRLIAAGLTQILSDTSYPFLVEGSVLDVLIVPIAMALFSAFMMNLGGAATPCPASRQNGMPSFLA